MKGSLIIDGIDMHYLGIFILEGGDFDLLSFPERKAPPANDWFEQDGLDVDLDDVYFKDKEVTVTFHIAADSADEYLYNLDTFYSILQATGYRELYTRELGRTYHLRYLSCETLEQVHGLSYKGRKHADIDVKFSLDNPLQFISVQEQPLMLSMPKPTHVRINGLDLAHYGIIVTNIYNTALVAPAAKAGLTISLQRQTGVIADTASKATKQKDVVVECVMQAPDRDAFWHNYEALFYQCSRPGAMSLELFDSMSLAVYYVKMDSFDKFKAFSSGVHVSFKLHLKTFGTGSVFIDNIRITEDGHERLLEDGEQRKL